MHDKLLGEFPETSYEQWRAQVDKDLKGGDFDKRLLTRTLDGLTIQPLYTARDLAPDVGLAAFRWGTAREPKHGARWDIRAEIDAADPARAKASIANELTRGASSLWLRFDRHVRLGASPGAEASAQPDGLGCENSRELAELLADVDLAKVPVVLDAGGAGPLAAAAYLALAAERGTDPAALRGVLGIDPLGALAGDGRLPYAFQTAQELALELAQLVRQRGASNGLRSFVVNATVYHDAGASSGQELACALSTALTYLRWLTGAGFSLAEAAAQLEFRIGVAGDLFGELAKLRALRLCFAKLIAASGGDQASGHSRLHAVTSRRTKTLRDPWVNMLRTTTEAFSAMAGGADALTTRGFDEAFGPSEPFPRRIARNVQVVLNEEAHVTHVADPAGGSYYLEKLTDMIARDAWSQFQKLEAAGGMLAALSAGSIQADIAAVAEQRAKAVAKRAAPITGVSEFANLAEVALVREQARADQIAVQNRVRNAQLRPSSPALSLLPPIATAAVGKRLAALSAALKAGAGFDAVSGVFASLGPVASVTALPLRRQAAPFEQLRSRADAYAAASGARLRGFLCNLGAIPQHKARASFASGFLNAGGIAAVDNDGFTRVADARAAFEAAGTKLVVICGGDDQYVEWVPELAPALRAAGASEILVAGRPGDHEAAFRAAGVSEFIYVGADVAKTLATLLDRLGVKP